MATIRRKKPEPFALLQRDPGPWSPILLYWLATLGIIIVFGLVMLFSASYTTGYLRFGDSLHYIKSQVLCLGLGLVAMFVFCFSIGVLLSFMMEKTGSLWAPALLHGAVNASAGLGILFQMPSEQAFIMRILGPSPLGLLSGLPFVIVALIILFKRKDSQL